MRTFSRHLSYLSLILFCCALGACATTSSTASLRTADGIRADSAYMAKVDRIATRRGVQVYWVNPPRADDHEVASR